MELRNWLSFHIHTNISLDDVIRKEIVPMINQLRSSHILWRYFFVRFSEGGPHLRLRINCSLKHSDDVRSYVTSRLQKFFAEQSLGREHIQPLASPSHVIATLYEPEVDRYGGLEAMAVSENQFELSSDLTLHFLQLPIFNNQTRITLALYQHLAFAFGCSASLKQVANLFKVICNTWTNHVCLKSREPVSRKQLFEQYNSNFRALESQIGNVFLPILRQFNSQLSFDDSSIQKWVEGIKNINADLIYLQNSKRFVAPRNLVNYNDPSDEVNERMAIYESYIHMANNRLGLRNTDEGFIAFIMVKLADAARSEV